MDLTKNSGVGGTEYSFGVPWLNLRTAAFDLVEKGEIKVTTEDEIPLVDLLDLKSIEVS